MLTEKQLFHDEDTTTLNIEVTKPLRDQLVNQHQLEISSGSTSLTFEQWCGGLLKYGHDAALYKHLKKIFES